MKNHWLDNKKPKVTIESLQAENAALQAKVQNMEAEYNAKLEEAYEQLSNELREAERTAEEGYQEAYDIICDLLNQLEEARGEKKGTAILKGFPPSNTISPCVKITDKDLSYKAPDDLETRLYAEYEEKVKQAKDFIVEKVDQFLKMEAEERDNLMAAHLRANYTPKQIVDTALEQ